MRRLAVIRAFRNDGRTMGLGAKTLEQAIQRLSPRQKDCLRLAAKAYVSKEIGRMLGISPATVDNHIRAALEILSIDGRAEAARALVAYEADQPLTSQSPDLAETRSEPPFGLASEPQSAPWRRLAPPLGGELHDLSREGRTFAILRVAVTGFAALILLTLGTVTLLWLLR